ncbi:hypothetical protein [Caballeronia glebae]|uniref:hypothetical protein n=1 Tax=Caballeronia glebae TaxID=1777143 RepID=UPI0038BB4CCB
MSVDTPLIFFRHDAKFMQARSSLERRFPSLRRALVAVSRLLPMLFHDDATIEAPNTMRVRIVR